jgi:glycosyltransferase involved in cell wall biosynthesis
MSPTEQAAETTIPGAAVVPGRRFVSIVTPTYNEASNVDELARRIRGVMDAIPDLDWEHIVIDNASVDSTVERVKRIIANDERVRMIVNARNFGQLRSPCHALLQARGDAVIVLASDLQDPPELIPELLRPWYAGAPVVAAVKRRTDEGFFLRSARSLYYALLERVADVAIVRDFTGFGLYDRKVVERLRDVPDAFPYLRGLVSDLGFAVARVPFDKPQRQRGLTSNSFFSLYDLAMVGLTTHSRVPLRMASMTGFVLSLLSAMVGIAYVIYKLLFWYQVPFGIAPLLIGMFFLGSVQLFFIGMLGEYLGIVHATTLRRPWVVERERVNWVDDSAPRAKGPSPQA